MPEEKAAATDYRYAPEPLANALATIARIIAILSLRAGLREGGGAGGVRRSRLPPAYRDALHGELRLLRAQLFASGLFAEIANVDVLADAVQSTGRKAASGPRAEAGAPSAAASGSKRA